MSLTPGAYSSLTTILMSVLPSAGTRKRLISCEKGSCSMLIATVFTFWACSSLTSSSAILSGIAEVGNQMLPGLTSRSATEAAELPTIGNL